MGPCFKGRLHLGLTVCMTVIFLFGPSFSLRADDCKRIQNILVLFDASGFMKEKNHYEQLITQMAFFTDAMPVTADGFFNVGLRHYGLKVGLGCNNTESILAIQPWDPERFMNAFPKTVSYGVSSLSAGLREAVDEVNQAEGKGIIVLIGGGVESCKADPIKIADRIAFNNPDLEIHTFQVGNSQDGRFFLEGIARLCHGTYHNTAEMSGAAAWHVWMRKHLVVPCGSGITPPGAPSASAGRQIGPVSFDYKNFSVRSKDPAVDAANLANLDAVGKYLQAKASSRVVLHGFTDGVGSQEYNLKLSRRRAEAVSRYLTATYGIPQQRIGIIAHGIAPDVTPGRVPTQRGARRTVEFELVD